MRTAPLLQGLTDKDHFPAVDASLGKVPADLGWRRLRASTANPTDLNLPSQCE